jgi:hypothetical protein
MGRDQATVTAAARGTATARSALAVSKAWGARVERLTLALIGCWLAVALSACSTRTIDIICPPAGVCPNTLSGHGGGY